MTSGFDSDLQSVDAHAAQRGIYVPTGRIAFDRFFLLSLVTLAAALFMAFLLDQAFVHNVYYIILMPILAALGVLPFLLSAIGFGHCRNRLFALVLAIVSSVVVYIGSYEFGLIREIGFENVREIQLLPSYIRYRMQTDVSEEHPGLTREPTAEPGMNWFKLGLEQLCVMALLVPAAYRRADRAYCETCKRWKSRALAFFPSGTGKVIGSLVATGQFETLAQMPKANLGPRDRRYTGLAVEYCRPDSEGNLCNAVVCVREVKHGGGVSSGSMFDWSFGRNVAPRFELTADELGPLRRILPELAAIVPGPLLPVEQSQRTTPPPLPVSGAIAQIIAVPDRFAGQILTRTFIILGNVLTLTPLLLMIGGAVLALWSLTHLDAHKDEPMWIAIAVAGGLVTAVSAFLGLRNPGSIPNRLLERRTRSLLGQRVERFFKVDDPAAVVVEVVPRAHWGKVMLETATDVGLLKIDPARKAVLFEGDRERWNIPAAAISHVTAEPATAGAGTAGEIRYYMTVIVAQTAEGLREFSFARRSTALSPPKDHREQAARKLEQEIRSLQGIAPAEATPSTFEL